MFVLIISCLWIALPAVEILAFAQRRVNTKLAFEALVARRREENSTMMIGMLADALEEMYSGTSAAGVQYQDFYRHRVAKLIGLARELQSSREGMPVLIDRSFQPGNTWPFDQEGKVKL